MMMMVSITTTMWLGVFLLLLQSSPHHGLQILLRKTLPSSCCPTSTWFSAAPHCHRHACHAYSRPRLSLPLHTSRSTSPSLTCRLALVSSGGVLDQETLARRDTERLQQLQTKIDEVLQLATVPQLSTDTMTTWDQQLRSLSMELRRLVHKSMLLQLYEYLLTTFASRDLDSLQLNTFEILSSAIVSGLFALVPRNAPITGLLDDLTDASLSFVEPFRSIIEEAHAKAHPGEDSFVSEAFLDHFCYQFAYLAQQTFLALHVKSGGEYDSSKLNKNHRVSNWISPILARLQRRFPKFSPHDVERRTTPLLTDSFSKLLRRLPVEVQPKYTLHASRTVTEGDADYPVWQLTDLYLRVIRNVISPDDPLSALESKVSQLFRDDMSSKVQRQLKPLSAMRSQLIRELTPVQRDIVEKVVSVGHETVAAVLLTWHIQQNIVGLQQKVISSNTPPVDEDEAASIQMQPLEYLHPMPSIRNSSAVLLGIPKQAGRDSMLFSLHNKRDRYQNVPETLMAASILAHSVRDTASEEYRALSIYNLDLDKFNANRDSVYISVLKEVVAAALRESPDSFSAEVFYEQLIAMAALEEVIGCREPRASCEEAYLSALAATILHGLDTANNPHHIAGNVTQEISTRKRTQDIKLALHFILRMSAETKESDLHKAAFEMAIGKLSAEFEDSRRKGLMRFVEPHYDWICSVLDIDQKWAKEYVQTLCIMKFDKAISSLLMNADLAISMPDMLSMFEKQLGALATEAMISVDEAEKRVVFLSGMTLFSLLDMALEEFQKTNINRVDIVLKKMYNAFQHPLIKALQAKESQQQRDIIEIGLDYLLREKRSEDYVMEMIRMLDSLRQRSLHGTADLGSNQIGAMSSGWGGSSSSSNAAIEAFNKQSRDVKEGMTAFLTKLQAYLLKEFAVGNAR